MVLISTLILITISVLGGSSIGYAVSTRKPEKNVPIIITQECESCHVVHKQILKEIQDIRADIQQINDTRTTIDTATSLLRMPYSPLVNSSPLPPVPSPIIF